MRRLAVVLLLLSASAARADGIVAVRHAYYKERATRVQQPMIDGSFDAGRSGHVDAHFLVDSITSASSATGSATGAPFTERRYEVGGAYTHALPDGIKAGLDFKYSTESDYFSTFAGAHGDFALFDQDTVLRLALGHSFDTITNGIAVSTGAIGTPRREEQLGTTLASATVTEILAPRLLAHLTYDFMLQDGYQANIYRVVRGGTQPVPERVPDLRLRHALAVGVRWFLPSKTTLAATYRVYLDDWGITAHTPEARVIQSFKDGEIDLRLRYRYYTQTRADFYKDVYSQSDLLDPSVFVTADAKLGAYDTHLLGGQASIALAAIGWRGVFADTRIDLTVEHIWQETLFGDAWVAQLGLSVPFSY